MQSYWYMIIFAIALISVGGLVKAKMLPWETMKYLAKHERVRGGVTAALVVILGLAIISSLGCSTGRFVQYTEVSAGIKWTDKQSPQCRSSPGVDDKGTSDLEIYQHIWGTHDGKFEWGVFRDHNSCFLNEDIRSSDAWGLKAKYKLYRRN